MQKIIIGTRGSALALWQAHFIQQALQKRYPKIEITVQTIKTTGDKILDAPLAKIGGKGLFTKELEHALLDDSIHLGVHSLKDVPIELAQGLMLAAITKREDCRDAFLSYRYASLDDLPKQAIVGTTSLRRSMQLQHKYPNLRTQHLRGNVQTRIKRLEEGKFDAIILAMAGVKRLNLQDQIPHLKPLDDMIPAMGQGALGLECKKDSEMITMLDFLHDDETCIETTAERAFIKALNGGCQVPIGVHACYDGSNLCLQAILGLPNGEKILRHQIKQPITNPKQAQSLGEQLASYFIQKGALAILQEAQEMLDF